MRVMVLVKATADSEAGALPSTELLEAMGSYNEELVKAGILLSGDGLKPSAAGKRVAFDGPGRLVIDGPFTETKELVAGFWLWQVKDMEEAIEWVKRCPNPMPGPSEIEIRPVYELSDFGDAFLKRCWRWKASFVPTRPAGSAVGNRLLAPAVDLGPDGFGDVVAPERAATDEHQAEGRRNARHQQAAVADGGLMQRRPADGACRRFRRLRRNGERGEFDAGDSVVS